MLKASQFGRLHDIANTVIQAGDIFRRIGQRLVILRGMGVTIGP
ncbi:hypothetical protein Amal_03921 [Acetobacter malorum]|uniref:Uncharacterized protein n=1 Tax=Acetobacter malorum TaxID=178901 RepID=A0A177G3F7_9PROT|nr:hypothetical protein Amal_03921 [Acetobacter malorum]